jgi:hypothetical protein
MPRRKELDSLVLNKELESKFLDSMINKKGVKVKLDSLITKSTSKEIDSIATSKMNLLRKSIIKYRIHFLIFHSMPKFSIGIFSD